MKQLLHQVICFLFLIQFQVGELLCDDDPDVRYFDYLTLVLTKDNNLILAESFYDFNFVYFVLFDTDRSLINPMYKSDRKLGFKCK